MKKLILLSAALISTNSFSGELNNYDQVKLAVSRGKSVHIVINHSECIASVKNVNFPSYTSVYNPKEIMINNDGGYMAASLMHFTLNDPQFPLKPVYGYARYTISHDGSVTLAFQTLDAINYSPLTDIYSYSCKLGESAKIYI